MTYSMLFYENETEFSRRENEEQGAYWGAWTSYIESLTNAGILVGGTGLMPPTVATSLRIKEGKRMVQDGPYADTKEQLGGFLNIEVDSLDQALEWAAKSPAATSGVVEIRPVMPPPEK